MADAASRKRSVRDSRSSITTAGSRVRAVRLLLVGLYVPLGIEVAEHIVDTGIGNLTRIGDGSRGRRSKLQQRDVGFGLVRREPGVIEDGRELVVVHRSWGIFSASGLMSGIIAPLDVEGPTHRVALRAGGWSVSAIDADGAGAPLDDSGPGPGGRVVTHGLHWL